MMEIEIFRVANGKLAEQWDIFDNWDVNAQLGLFDPDHGLNRYAEQARSGDRNSQLK